MTVTFVTALVNLHEERPNEKNVDRYVSLLNRLAAANIRLHAFVSPECIDRIRLKHGVVEPIELETLNAYRKAPQELPANRTMTKDTRNFLIMMNSKAELVRLAIDSGKHTSTHYAWIDAGICHVFRNTASTLEYMSLLDQYRLPATCMYMPGCTKSSHRSLDSIDWRFCGGFFLGDVASVRTLCGFYDRYYAYLPKLSWEVNVWAFFETVGWKPDWYDADHNDSIVRIPFRQSIFRVPRDAYLYWHGELSKCYVNSSIERYVQTSIDRQSPTTPVLFVGSDGLHPSQYTEIKAAAPRSIVATLCSRNLHRPDVLVLPLDDDTFEHGLSKALSSYRPVPWDRKKPLVFWRGGTSGVDAITPRMRVVDALVNHPHCDVRFTHGVSDASDARVAPHKFAPYRVSIGDHFHHKFILIVDGNMIASSHQWVFGSGSVPVMITHPDNQYWFQRFLQPMKNYVPIAYDLSDLEEKIEWLVTHDDEARQIAEEAMYLVKMLFSPEFQRAYIDVQIRQILDGMRTSTVGVAIPCYRPHVPKLKRCLDSIEAQAVKPDEVVVVCSSAKSEDIPGDWTFSFSLKIITREDRRNAAQNRNQAASVLTTEYVSFFDADDIMHPQRIECLKKCDADIILHSFSDEDVSANRVYPTYMRGVLVRAPSGCADCTHAEGCRIHHAHATVRREVLQRIQFREEEEYERREDAVFCGDVLALSGVTSTYIPDALSMYTPEGYTMST